LIFTPWACFFPGRLPVLSPFVSGSHEPPFSVGGVYYTAAGRETWPPSSENKRSPEDIIFHSCRPRYHSRGGGYSLLFFHIPISFFIMQGRAIHFPRSRPRERSRGLFLFDRGGSGRPGPASGPAVTFTPPRSCRDLLPRGAARQRLACYHHGGAGSVLHVPEELA
jgi:hypothetical protein